MLFGVIRDLIDFVDRALTGLDVDVEIIKVIIGLLSVIAIIIILLKLIFKLQLSNLPGLFIVC